MATRCHFANSAEHDEEIASNARLRNPDRIFAMTRWFFSNFVILRKLFPHPKKSPKSKFKQLSICEIIIIT